MLFGAIVWGAADETRFRPEWAQWLTLALWAGIAAFFLNWALEGAYESGAEEMGQKMNEELQQWIEDNEVAPGNDQ